MNETKYLYGASVQGIQGFIFQSNELKSIVGASELVERICTQLFTEGNPDEGVDGFQGSGKLVVNAAGNIKCIYNNEEDCCRAVRLFPKTVMENAPGITISQAVVKCEGKYEKFAAAVEELERRLRIQRSRPAKSLTLGMMAVARSRKTGLPAVEQGTDELLDEATVAKRKHAPADHPENTTLKLAKKSFGNAVLSWQSIAFDIKDLTRRNDWVAIIHADGNGLGAIVAQMNEREDDLHEFSEKLDKATACAARRAYEAVVKDGGYEPGKGKVPFRPIVLGGDDMTMLCRADVAMKYTQSYLKFFEEKTKNMGHPLTACAGIAYMKSSYPFYYGYRLAESLCDAAKKDAKREEHLRDGLAPSCLMFHKIQSSFVVDYKQLVDNELTLREGGSFQYGPYYLAPMSERWTIDDLVETAQTLATEEKNSVKTDIRQWMTLMAKSAEEAKQKEKRVRAISTEEERKLFGQCTAPTSREAKVVYPAYDVLSLLTVENQITKA